MRTTWAAIVMVLDTWTGSAPAQDFSAPDPVPPAQLGRGTRLPVTGQCAPAKDCPTPADVFAAAKDWDIRETAAIERALDNDGTLHMAYQRVNRIRGVRCGSLVMQDPVSVTCRLTLWYGGRPPNHIRARFIRDRGVWLIQQVVPDLVYGQAR